MSYKEGTYGILVQRYIIFDTFPNRLNSVTTQPLLGEHPIQYRSNVIRDLTLRLKTIVVLIEPALN